jgi:hypothetical protein
MNHYHDLADRCLDPVYKQHLRNYANALDATECAADAYKNLEPEQFETPFAYQNKVNEMFRYLVEMNKEQVETCHALWFYVNRERIRLLSYEALLG